jgi:hypothetical protein
VDAFLLSRRVANHSSRTLEIYAANLARFARATRLLDTADASALVVQRYLTGLRDRLKPISIN